MSLVVGLLVPGGVLIMGDTRQTRDGAIEEPVAKVFRHGEFVVGAVGATADLYHFFHGLPEGADLSDPALMLRRAAECLKIIHKARPSDTFNARLLIGRGAGLWSMDDAGYEHPVQHYQAIGSGTSIAHYLLRRDVLFAAHQFGSKDAVKMGQFVIGEVATVDATVALPAQWLFTTQEAFIDGWKLPSGSVDGR